MDSAQFPDTWSLLILKPPRESSNKIEALFCKLIAEVPFHCCHILLVRSNLLKGEDYKSCEYWEVKVGIVRAILEPAFHSQRG